MAMLRPGTRLGCYRLVRLLGHGGMGSVFEAMHEGLGKRVALKTLHAFLGTGPDDRERFLREGRAAALLRHPHVVQVFDADHDPDSNTMFLVMEFLEGEDLHGFLEREGRVDAARATDLMLPVLAALAMVHAQGIVHRDLKPQNVFLAKNPCGDPLPKILDFGISKLQFDSGLTPTGEVLGTPHYISPEHVLGRTADARSDQFSMGVMLYELVSGERPFDGPNLPAVLASIVEHPVPALADRVPLAPAGFVAAVTRTLAKRPADRFESVQALGRALLPFGSERSRVLWGSVFQAPAAPPVTLDNAVTRITAAPAPNRVDSDATPRGVSDLVATLPPAALRQQLAETRPAGTRDDTTRPPRARGRAERPQVHVFSATDPQAVQRARLCVGSAPELALLAVVATADAARRPFPKVLAAGQGRVTLVLLAGQASGWEDPADELCRALAPQVSGAKGCYLFFEEGRLIHWLKRDLWDPAADEPKLVAAVEAWARG